MICDRCATAGDINKRAFLTEVYTEKEELYRDAIGLHVSCETTDCMCQHKVGSDTIYQRV